MPRFKWSNLSHVSTDFGLTVNVERCLNATCNYRVESNYIQASNSSGHIAAPLKIFPETKPLQSISYGRFLKLYMTSVKICKIE